MIVMPVLDLLDGIVVRGIAGRRDLYRPIISGLTKSSLPGDVALAIRDSYGLNRFYLADLDGIQKRRPNFVVLENLASSGFELVVDAGTVDCDDARSLRATGISCLIAGLESCRGPDALAEIVSLPGEVIFSLDLMNGTPRRPEGATGWCEDPREIVRQVHRANVSAVLPLDLADVGTGTGGSTDELCRFIRSEFPRMDVIAGGGVRGPDDLKRYHSLGVKAVLVASALHDRRLSREDVHAWQ